MTDKPIFHVIDGTPAPDTPLEQVRKRVRARPKPAGMLQCPRCAGRALIERKLGVMIRQGGKPFGGTKQWICAGPCLAAGELVVVC